MATIYVGLLFGRPVRGNVTRFWAKLKCPNQQAQKFKHAIRSERREVEV